MKRIFIVDDERPVVDHLVRLIDREGFLDYHVVGTAASGREALELIQTRRPDIIIMDVKMPGLSGLETVRELKKRGVAAAFLLATAYERFDIAREALELGIIDYILKPVVRETLLKALDKAAEYQDRQTGVDHRKFDHLESDTQTQGFLTEAFMRGITSGWGFTEPVDTVAGLLWPGKPWGLVSAVRISQDPAGSHRNLCSLVQYKTQAHCGPLVSDWFLVFQPLASQAEGPDARATLENILGTCSLPTRSRDLLRVGFADLRPVREVICATTEALNIVFDRNGPVNSVSWSIPGGGFETDIEFHLALVQNNSQGVRQTLDFLLAPFEGAESVNIEDKYRIICLLGSALGRLAGLGALDPVSVRHWMDFSDLLGAQRGWEFCLAARSWLPVITGALSSWNRCSVWTIAAQNYISANYGNALTLEIVADYVGVTPKKLSRLFIDELGQGFSDYLIDFRIGKAKVILSLAGASIKQVAAECGYADANYFSRLFKKLTGMTPTEFSTAS